MRQRWGDGEMGRWGDGEMGEILIKGNYPDMIQEACIQEARGKREAKGNSP
ncbi:MAG: hypothetical protein F6K63_17985 [Moorea sp. SIO1G6]|uniref:hypothetical protein n=1 Tax=Moorena sp. SIO1G6 TaxID=2607840 RepID=UPI0013C103D4|nr:hypothetical protein [Moorena sp. SIO1G6]NET66171.1 hypothetical protein [Moorena sp. SIO1G6]